MVGSSQTDLPSVTDPRTWESTHCILSPIRPHGLVCCAPRLAETPFRADMIRRRVTMKTQTTERTGIGLGRGGRMSRQRKCDAVLRLVRGEDLEILSRALGV